MRAADILAARLPTVPDKPATDPAKPGTNAPTAAATPSTSPAPSHVAGTTSAPGAPTPSLSTTHAAGTTSAPGPQNSAGNNPAYPTAQLKSSGNPNPPKPVKPAGTQTDLSTANSVPKPPKTATSQPETAMPSPAEAQPTPAQEQGPPQ
jgi:hypothetical protein